jgi:UDP-glucose 4-epimerase
MKIVVTGSAGHLGEALMRTLRRGPHEALGIDIAASQFTDAVGSITDAAFVARCLQGAQAVLHTATLHKPHVATHTQQDFIATNLGGTLTLLEAARREGVRAFVFTSTTSAFGAALNPPSQAPAVWVTETLAPRPRNIYGVTKVAAEDLCELHHRRDGLPCIVLRTSRFFPEDDDRADMRAAFGSLNTKVNEYLHRRVDIEDVVTAHLLAIERAADIGFGRYVISATTPFVEADLAALRTDASAVVARLFPDQPAEYAQRQWRMFETLDRVYVNERARLELGWQPRHDFRSMLDRLKRQQDPTSALAREIGIKGYHARAFDEGPYPV